MKFCAIVNCKRMIVVGRHCPVHHAKLILRMSRRRGVGPIYAGVLRGKHA